MVIKEIQEEVDWVNYMDAEVMKTKMKMSGDVFAVTNEQPNLVVARMDPLKYLFEKPALSGKLSRWLILLAGFDLKYVARKTIKGSAVSDFCVENPIEREDGKEDFPSKEILDVELGTWKMYFDGAVNQYGNGIGILLITPERSHLPLAIKLNFEPTNNMAEYKETEVFGDSTLVIAQAQKLWKVKEEHLKPYQKYLEDLTKTFDKIEYTIIPKAQNQLVDDLVTLASMVKIPEGAWTRPLEIEQSYEEVHKRKTEASVMTIEEEEVSWYYNIMKFLELGAYSDGVDKRERRSIRMMAIQYILSGG
nr:uncharacterized protein LOC112029013 [Quercus suber]